MTFTAKDTYRYRAYREMEKRFGVDVADRAFSLEIEVDGLRACHNKLSLVLDLRHVAEIATSLANEVEGE